MKNFAAIEQTGFLFIGSGARLRKKGAGGGIKALLKRLQAQRRRAARQSQKTNFKKNKKFSKTCIKTVDNNIDSW